MRSRGWCGDRFTGIVDGFAAGPLLVILVGSMIPEAKEKGWKLPGLAAVLGFAVAAGLSAVARVPLTPFPRWS
jgi:ZIP family zinc transporter